MPSRLPNATARIPDHVAAEIVRRVDLYGVSQAEIARRLQVNRRTVSRVLERTRAARNVVRDLGAEYSRALAVYRDLQRRALEAAEDARARGKSPAPLLAEARQCQTRIDALLGLEPAESVDPQLQLAAFRDTVLVAIREIPPESAPAAAGRLLDMAKEMERNGRDF